MEDKLFNYYKSLILPSKDNSKNEKYISIEIDSNSEVRNRQYGMMLELYYIYTYHRILELNNKENNFDRIDKLLELEKLQLLYEDILLLRYIYYDCLLKKEIRNSETISFIDNNLFDIIFYDNKESNDKEYISKKISEINNNFIKGKTNKIIKIIIDYSKRDKSDYFTLLKLLFNIINNLNIADNYEKEKAKAIAIIGIINQKTNKQKNYKLIFKNFESNCIETIKELNNDILSIQQYIIEIQNNNKNINKVYNIKFKDIRSYLDRLPKKLSEDYEEYGRRCVAIGEDSDERYISFSGSEYTDKKLKKSFEKIINKNYVVVYLEDDVRCYYDNKHYIEYRDIKKHYNINANGEEDSTFIINRSCSCCERKLLQKLNLNGHIKIIIKLPPCQICMWAIDDMAKTYTIYFNPLTQTDKRIIKTIKDKLKILKYDINYCNLAFAQNKSMYMQ